MMGAAHEFTPVELVARVHCSVEMEIHGCKELAMSENGFRGVDLFKIAGESISGWIPSWKLGGQKPSRLLPARRQPFPSFPELAEALQVVWPWSEAATIPEIVERLGERWSPAEKE